MGIGFHQVILCKSVLQELETVFGLVFLNGHGTRDNTAK